MKILQARNVHDALPHALKLLEQEGIETPSRNGPVLQAPWPVTTVYSHPCERVLFHPERDANPFFHLYEALWMLAGRQDVEGPARYAKQMREYSDDGKTFHGAYGYRWREHFSIPDPYSGTRVQSDQLWVIAERLKANPLDRRCILQMWDVTADLGREGKDFPCNTIATFQRGFRGELNLTVFCRSNDIVWGCYGANAVHFSMLLEYMALWIGCKVGTYTQISVNWHGYLSTLEPLKNLRPDRVGFISNPYVDGRVRTTQMFHGDIEDADQRIKEVLTFADTGVYPFRTGDDEPFFAAALLLFRAHRAYKAKETKEAYAILDMGDPKNDWIVAAKQWIHRRAMKQVLAGEVSHG